MCESERARVRQRDAMYERERQRERHTTRFAKRERDATRKRGRAMRHSEGGNDREKGGGAQIRIMSSIRCEQHARALHGILIILWRVHAQGPHAHATAAVRRRMDIQRQHLLLTY